MADYDLTQEEALELLRAREAAGRLKIITPIVRAEFRAELAPDDRRNPILVARDEVDLKDPGVFEWRDVVSVEGPTEKGRYVAHAADGSYTEGYPLALLKRLSEWASAKALQE